ncbi:MAG: hypothetical protein ACAF41_11135 [Leptolyngbya sp. BL-A-14]
MGHSRERAIELGRTFETALSVLCQLRERLDQRFGLLMCIPNGMVVDGQTCVALPPLRTSFVPIQLGKIFEFYGHGSPFGDRKLYSKNGSYKAAL